jgi:hypothetical protein
VTTLNEKYLLDDDEVAFVVGLVEERLDEIAGVLRDGETRVEVDGPNAGKSYLKAISDEDKGVYERAAERGRAVLAKLRP